MGVGSQVAEQIDESLGRYLYKQLTNSDIVDLQGQSYQDFKKSYLEDGDGRQELFGYLQSAQLGGVGGGDSFSEWESELVIPQAGAIETTKEDIAIDQPQVEIQEEVVDEGITPTETIDETTLSQDAFAKDSGDYGLGTADRSGGFEWSKDAPVVQPPLKTEAEQPAIEKWTESPYDKEEPKKVSEEDIRKQKAFESAFAQMEIDKQKKIEEFGKESVMTDYEKMIEAEKKEREKKAETAGSKAADEAIRLENKLRDLKHDMKTVLNTEEEIEFQDWLYSNVNMREYVEEHNKRAEQDSDEPFNPDNIGYDYRGMWKAGEEPTKTKEKMFVGNENENNGEGWNIWKMPEKGEFDQDLYPFNPQTYHIDEYTELFGFTPPEDAAKEEILLAIDLQKAKIAQYDLSKSDPNATLSDLIKTQPYLTPEQIEWNETVEELNVARQIAFYGKEKWFKDYTRMQGSTPIEDGRSKMETLEYLLQANEDYEIDADFDWETLETDFGKDLSTFIKEKGVGAFYDEMEKKWAESMKNQKQFGVQVDSFKEKYKKAFGSEIDLDFEQHLKDVDWWGADQEYRKLSKDPTQKEILRKQFYEQGAYKLSLQQKKQGNIINAEKIIQEVVNPTMNINELGNVVLWDIEKMEETIIPQWRKKYGKLALTKDEWGAVEGINHEAFLTALLQYQKRGMDVLSFEYTLAGKTSTLAEQNGVNLVDPREKDAAQKIKTKVAEGQVMYGFNHLNKQQQIIFNKVEQLNILRVKDDTLESPQDRSANLQEIETLKKEIEELKNNPLELYDLLTGKWLNMPNKEEALKNEEAVKYERMVNEESHLLRKKYSTDALVGMWDGASSKLQYWESELDKTYKVRIGHLKMTSEFDGEMVYNTRFYTMRELISQGRMGSDFGDKEYLKSKAKLYNEKWKDAKGNFDKVNRALLLNEDPAGIKTWTGSTVREGVGGFVNDFGEKLVEGFGVEVDSDADFATYLFSELKSQGVELNQTQMEIFEEDVSTMTSSALGSSIQPMVAIIGSSILLQPAWGIMATVSNSVRAMRIAKVVLLKKWGRSGKFMYHTMKGSLQGAFQFGLAPSDMLSWQMGAGEGATQQLITGFNVGRKLKGKWGKLLMVGMRVGGGTVAESMAEYAGEFTDQLSKTGYDWETAIDRTFGGNIDQATKKLFTTALVSFCFSSAFNLKAGAIAMKQIENMPKTAERTAMLDELHKMYGEAQKNVLKAAPTEVVYSKLAQAKGFTLDVEQRAQLDQWNQQLREAQNSEYASEIKEESTKEFKLEVANALTKRRDAFAAKYGLDVDMLEGLQASVPATVQMVQNGQSVMMPRLAGDLNILYDRLTSLQEMKKDPNRKYSSRQIVGLQELVTSDIKLLEEAMMEEVINIQDAKESKYKRKEGWEQRDIKKVTKKVGTTEEVISDEGMVTDEQIKINTINSELLVVETELAQLEAVQKIEKTAPETSLDEEFGSTDKVKRQQETQKKIEGKLEDVANLKQQRSDLGWTPPPAEYTIDGEAVTEDEMVNKLGDPAFQKKLKDGDADMTADNSSEDVISLIAKLNVGGELTTKGKHGAAEELDITEETKVTEEPLTITITEAVTEKALTTEEVTIKENLDAYQEEKGKKPKDRTRLTTKKKYDTEQKKVQRELGKIITGKTTTNISGDQAAALESELDVEFKRNSQGNVSMSEVLKKTVESDITSDQLINGIKKTKDALAKIDADLKIKSEEESIVQQKERVEGFKKNADIAKKLKDKSNKALDLARDGKMDEANKLIEEVEQEASKLPTDVGGLDIINRNIADTKSTTKPKAEVKAEVTEKVEPEVTDKVKAKKEVTKEETEVSKQDLGKDINDKIDNAFKGRKKSGKKSQIDAWFNRVKTVLDGKSNDAAGKFRQWSKLKNDMNEILDKNTDLTQDQKILRDALAKKLNDVLKTSNYEIKSEQLQDIEGKVSTENVLALKEGVVQEKKAKAQTDRAKKRLKKGDKETSKKKQDEVKAALKGKKVGDKVSVNGETLLVTDIIRSGKGERVIYIKPAYYRPKKGKGDIAIRQKDGSYKTIDGKLPKGYEPVFETEMTAEQSKELVKARDAQKVKRTGHDVDFYNQVFFSKAWEQETTTLEVKAAPTPKVEGTKPKKVITEASKKVNTENQVKKEAKEVTTKKNIDGDPVEEWLSEPIKAKIDNELSTEQQLEVLEKLKITPDKSDLGSTLLSDILTDNGNFETQQESEKTMKAINDILAKDAQAVENIVDEVETSKVTMDKEVEADQRKADKDLKKLEDQRKKDAHEITSDTKKEAAELAKKLQDAKHPWAESVGGDFVAKIEKLLDNMGKHALGEMNISETWRQFYSMKPTSPNQVNILAKDGVTKEAQQTAKQLTNLLNLNYAKSNQTQKLSDQIKEKQNRRLIGELMYEDGWKDIQEGAKESRSSLGMYAFGSPTMLKMTRGLIKITVGRAMMVANSAVNISKEYLVEPISKRLKGGLDVSNIISLVTRGSFAIGTFPLILAGKAYGSVAQGVGKLLSDITGFISRMINNVVGYGVSKVFKTKLANDIYKRYLKIMKGMTDLSQGKKLKYVDGDMQYNIQSRKNYEAAVEQALKQPTSRAVIDALIGDRNFANQAQVHGLSSEYNASIETARALSTLINQLEALKPKNFRQIKKLVSAELDIKTSRYTAITQGQISKKNKGLSKLMKGKLSQLIFGENSHTETITSWKYDSDYIAETMRETTSEVERIAITMIMQGQKRLIQNAPVRNADIAAVNKILANFEKGIVSPEMEVFVGRKVDGKRTSGTLDVFYDDALEFLQENEQLVGEGILENYFPSIYNIKKFSQEMHGGLMKTRHTKQKMLGDYNAGMLQGFVPISLDASDITKMYSKNISNAVAKLNLINSLMDMSMGDGSAIAMEADKAPDSWKTINNPAFRKIGFAGKKSNGEPIFAYKNIKVHPDAYSILAGIIGDVSIGEDTTIANRKMYGTSLADIVLGVERVNNIRKKFQLAFSFFHHMALTETLLGTMNSFTRGLKMGGNPLKLFAEVLGFKKAGINVDDLMLFKNQLKFKDAMSHGLRVEASPDVAREVTDSILDKLVGGRGMYSQAMQAMEEKMGVKMNPVRGARKLTKAMDRFLWDYMHNNYKLVAYEAMLEDGLTQLAKDTAKLNLSPEQQSKRISEMKKRIAKHVNNTFGGQVWESLGVSPRFIRMCQLLMLSPDWTVSTLKQAIAPLAGLSQTRLIRMLRVSGLKGDKISEALAWGARQIDVGNGKTEEISKVETAQLRKTGYIFWARGAMMYYGFMNILNLATTALWGDKDEDKEEWDEIKETVVAEEPDLLKKIVGKGGDIVGLEGLEEGKWMHENDLSRKWKIYWGKREDGRKRYLSVGKQFMEIPHLYEDGLTRRLGKKAAPIMQDMNVVMFGHTAGDFQVYDTEKTTAVERAAGQLILGMLPFSTQNAVKELAGVGYYDPYGTTGDKILGTVYHVSKGMSKTEFKKGFAKAVENKDPETIAELWVNANDNGIEIPAMDILKMFDRIEEDYIMENFVDKKFKSYKYIPLEVHEFPEVKEYKLQMRELKLTTLIDVMMSDKNDYFRRYMYNLMERGVVTYPTSKKQLLGGHVDVEKMLNAMMGTKNETE